VLLRYLLMFTGIGLLAGAAGILLWDLYQIWKSRKLGGAPQPIRWDVVKRMAAFSLGPLLAGWSIAVVPSGSAGVRVNQFVGTRPATLYACVHFVMPRPVDIETY